MVCIHFEKGATKCVHREFMMDGNVTSISDSVTDAVEILECINMGSLMVALKYSNRASFALNSFQFQLPLLTEKEHLDR